MSREVILFYTDDSYKTFSESEVHHITKEDLKRSSYALVSVGQCDEVQCYLPIRPEYLVTNMKPGTFSYCFEYSVYSADITEDPELYPMNIQTVKLESIFDLYDSIYFLAEIIFTYDIMNPNKFDDYRVLDVLEVTIDIPESSKKHIWYHNRIKKTRVTSVRNLVAEDIYINLRDTFGIDMDLIEPNHPWIKILKHNKWTTIEKLISDKNKTEIVAFPLSTDAMIFSNVNTLVSLDDVDVPMVTVYMYDETMVEESKLSEIHDEQSADEILDDAWCGFVNSALISRAGVLTFLIECKFIDECFKLTMQLHEFCNINGVLYILRSGIQRQMFSPVNGSSMGFIKSEVPFHWIYDFDHNKNKEKPLSQYLIKYEKCLRGKFVFNNEVPF